MKPIAITENHLYKKAYLGGKRAGGYFTVVYVLKDKKAYRLKKENPQKKYINRIGISVSKKIGGAVQRNRAKRVIRAAFSEIEKEYALKKGYLIVISAKEASVVAKSTDVQAEMKKLLEKLEMLEKAENTAFKEFDCSEKVEDIAFKEFDCSEKVEDIAFKEFESSEKVEDIAFKEMLEKVENTPKQIDTTEKPVTEKIEKGNVSEDSESTSEILG